MPDVDEGIPVALNDFRGALPVGTILGGYELISILGKGGFGITYRARDFAHNQDVAIKEYLPTALAIREGRTTVLPISTNHAEQFAWGRERFLDEARTLERLDHAPAVVRVLDFLEANGTAYMVMALVEGETLNKRLMREPRLAPEVIERLLFPLLDGLEQVHAASFLHRDIKPANIMVDPHDRPTLIDFGASRAAMAGRSTTLTAIFTPGYAAAEQFVSSKQGPWTDIYGLAATIYHAITGANTAERNRAHYAGCLSVSERPAPARVRAWDTGRHRCRDGCPCGRPTANHRGMAANAAVRGPANDADRAQAGFGGARGAQDQKRRHHNQGSGTGGCSGQRARFAGRRWLPGLDGERAHDRKHGGV
jgi:hypothetical protein